MKNKLNYYRFISKMTTTFLKNYDFDKGVNRALKLLSKKTNADRAYIFLFKDDGNLMDNTHEYCQKGVLSAIKDLQDIETYELKWWMKQLNENRIIDIKDVDSMPKEASIEKETLQSQEIKSIICFPFFSKRQLRGFVGLDNVKDSGAWDEISIEYLNIATSIIAKAFERETDRKKISQTNSTLKAILETSTDAIVAIKKDGSFLNYNDNFVIMWDIEKEIRSGSNDQTLTITKNSLLSPSPDEFEKRIKDTLKDSLTKDIFLAFRKDGSIIEINSTPMYVDDEHMGRVYRCSDITSQKKYEQKLQLIAKVFEKSNDAILITDKNINIIDTNSAFERITGYNFLEVYGKNPSLLQSNWHDKDFYKGVWEQIETNGYWEGEIWDRRKNGETYVNKSFISKIENEGNVTNYIGISKDITQSKEYENKITQLAYYDALTSLPNRAYFEQNLESVIDESKRYNRKFAVMFLDLDNFKYVNDTFGHLIGDKLLQDVSNKLKSCVRKSDIVARLGGDEFTIIIKEINNTFDIDPIAKKIIKKISDPINIEGNELHVGTSIGICIYPDDSKLSAELTKKADIAMYNSKNGGKNRYTFFNENMNNSIMQRYKIEQFLRDSIENDNFYLEYQPFIGSDTKTINGVEALIRWEHPELGKLLPGNFIPIAEENGMIIKLGEWIFKRVCLDIDTFKMHNINKVCINISAKQLMDTHFAKMVQKYIKEYDVDTSILEFEITESILLDNNDIILNNLKKLRVLGITFALDDFGTGYSSLNYIKQFSIDTIKIDRSFVEKMCLDEKDMAIVNTILYLSKELDKNIVAEGVETNEQLKHFEEHERCDIQGYLFSKPFSINKIEALVKDGKLI